MDEKYIISALKMLRRLVKEYEIAPRVAIDWVAASTMIPVKMLVEAYKRSKREDK